MDRLDAMRIFLSVAEKSGFAEAARHLRLSPPSVTRAIASLEERLGTSLFQRSTRHVRLTQAGQRFLMDARRILADLEEAEASAAGDHGAPTGDLAITASQMFGSLYIAPLVQDFLSLHPGVNARLLLLDRVTNLIDEGFDIAVRIAQLQDSSLRAIRVGAVRRVIVAAPDYLARHGEPQKPDDLLQHDAIAFSSAAAADQWIFRDNARVAPPARFTVNSSDVAIKAAIAGRGVTRVLSYMVAPALARGELKILLADYELPPTPVQLVHAEGRRANAKVRAFLDFAVEKLRTEPVLQN
ncbi:LysR family transcriptional regulator [Ferrovibrio terrae]|uniref:LysR family transcriptional regulator n=1 Tax=Ferrovibrio terrae TaxID=2594003 RepID=A0A516GZ16_9PROT|nr:LysR family transcriptional regulator [Ferrovibrio terrae]QDO96769.1 LysR family transcriptional regulator [Ferrovibrio terrae]